MSVTSTRGAGTWTVRPPASIAMAPRAPSFATTSTRVEPFWSIRTASSGSSDPLSPRSSTSLGKNTSTESQHVDQIGVPPLARIEAGIERRRQPGCASVPEKLLHSRPQRLLQIERRDVHVVGAREERPRHVPLAHRRDRSQERDERAIGGGGDRDRHARLQSGIHDDRLEVDPSRAHGVQAEVPRGVVADLAEERDGRAEPREAHRADGRGAPEHHPEVVDEDLAPGGRKGVIPLADQVDVDLPDDQDALGTLIHESRSLRRPAG